MSRVFEEMSEWLKEMGLIRIGGQIDWHYFLPSTFLFIRVGAVRNRAPEPHDALSGLHPRMTMVWAPRP